jgi:hypothetical protein
MFTTRRTMAERAVAMLLIKAHFDGQQSTGGDHEDESARLVVEGFIQGPRPELSRRHERTEQ